MRSQGYIYSRLWADAWCAAFVWKKVRDHSHPYPITEELFRKIERNPFHVVNTWHEQEIRRLAEQYQFFHWHLAFPDVFRVPVGRMKSRRMSRQDGMAGLMWCWGIRHGSASSCREEVQFFAARAPEIAKRKAQAAAKGRHQGIAADWLCSGVAMRTAVTTKAKASFVRNSGVYPLTGVGCSTPMRSLRNSQST